MDVTAGFSRSERSRNNLGRNSNCSGSMFYGRENLWIGLDQNTLLPMALVFLHISRKLLTVLLAERDGVYCHNLASLCVKKCGNRGGVMNGSKGHRLSRHNGFKVIENENLLP